MRSNVAAIVRLMLVTDDRLVAGRDLVALALEAERGGVTCVQLRLKDAEPRALVSAAAALVAALRVPVLVNDRPDVAVIAGAAGVHLGPGDLPPRLARRVLPPHAIIGASAGSAGEAIAAGDADYWGVGPWRETGTKADAGAALGSAGFEAIVKAAGGRPCIAIGGVLAGDVPAVLAAGGAGVAVASGILATEHVAAAAREYAERLGA
ncbi:MAG TPA: thiamine phosphate synthase [Gemmatimonadales bacterium]|nr:thiamine phosphate synthase [Gemmatimonadales bacterium]